MDNKLRLQIVTQLDAAGIKATKDQIDQLELGVRRAGNAGQDSGQKFGQLEKALGKLPGPLGDIGKNLGGIGSMATMVIGAFTTGIEIGNKIYENIVGPLQDWIYGTKELETAEKNYAASLVALKENLAAVTAEEMKRFDESAAGGEKTLKMIDDQTAAYFRQATALAGLKKAEGNAEMMQLERSKFEDMRQYAEAGAPEAAEQVGKYYDVLIAELSAKQQLAEFDRDSVKLTKDLTSAEEAYAKAAQRASEAKDRQTAAEAELAHYRAKNGIGGNAMYTSTEDELRDDQLEKIAERARKDAEKAAAVAAKRGERLENVDAEVLTRQMERANLAAGGALSIDRAAAAYDDYVSLTDNPLNATIDQSWANDLLKNAEETADTQDKLLDVVKTLSRTIENALTDRGE